MPETVTQIDPQTGEAIDAAEITMRRAAPDMLAALKEIAAGLADTGSTPGKYMTRISKPMAADIARAAIAKAEGRETFDAAAYLARLKAHNWWYAYASNYAIVQKGEEEARALRALADEHELAGRMFDRWLAYVNESSSDEPTLDEFV
jgi:hypothetical protein